ncbi:MAG: helix-hairpin-helix domain-containing protein, partial [Cocleimonas sp.]|nr:helix-hairpin-helix domain-containing protein [Cocleimonas sp.]
GAISIARRLQDPLAELVKIEAKAIGVGQYQHDVSQVQLAKNLDAVVEDCVNSVGVEVNTASAALLRRVAGLNQTIADNIVALRDEKGRFSNRKELKKVARLGPKAFEQAAGFLRIHEGDNPLDASAVHPESYSIVSKIAAANDSDIGKLIGDSRTLKSLNPADYTNETFGLPTIVDIIRELDKPGRDPRPAFKTASFKDGIEKISDLKESMILEGTVTNVTNFGAFVDIGVHQDGLVHISALADSFVKDPHDVVKAGDIVKVKVMDIDPARKRIALTMRLNDSVEQKEKAPQKKLVQRTSQKHSSRSQKSAPTNNAFAAAFAKAQGKQ